MEDSPSKPSVAELAGRFKGHILPTPPSSDQFRRKPPCSLKLRNPTDGNEEADKCAALPAPSRIRMKNSAIIEKLQANLALSPTALLPSPRSPEVKLRPAPPSPSSPPTPLSPSQHLSSEEEEEQQNVAFIRPPDGVLLPSINKTRARLSFKRRLPTRQHRRSAGDEAGAFGGGRSPSEPCSPKENGDDDPGSDNKEEEEEEEEDRREDDLEADRSQDVDCEKTEAEAAEDGGDAEEAETQEEEKLQPSGPTGQKEEEEEEEEEEERENDRM